MGLLFGFLNELVRRKNQKRIAKNVRIQNQNSKGIVKYKPSDIEAFLTREDYISGNTLATGYPIYKNRLVLQSIYEGISNGFKSVVLNCGSSDIKDELLKTFSDVLIFDSSTKRYDPFIGLSNQSIFRMIKSSSTKNITLSSEAKYYIDGICNFIRSKGIAPYVHMLITCPHDSLLSKVDSAESNGKISSSSADDIRRSLMQGQTQRYNVESYFDELNHQCGPLFSTSLNIKQSANINIGLGGHDVIYFDLMNPGNELAFNLICEDLMNAIYSKKKINIVLYDVPLAANKQILNLTQTRTNSNRFTVISDDIFGDLRGDNNSFIGLCSLCSQIFVLKHANGLSTDAISKLFGTYKEQKLNTNYTSANNYEKFGTVLPGKVDEKGMNISEEFAPILSSRDIQTMKENEFYVLSNREGNVSYSIIK